MVKISKLFLTLFFSSAVLPAFAQEQSYVNYGSLRVNGTPGTYQYFARVKAQRCAEPSRSYDAEKKSFQWSANCDEPVFFDLNTDTELPVGNYILGFENSIFPGFVQVQAHQYNVIDLVKLEVPRSLSKEKSIRVFRDFSFVEEQQKIYLQLYYTGKHFFRITNRYTFEDYYLADSNKPDILQRIDYKFCNVVKLFKLREHAQFACDTWNNAKSYLDMADLFRFNNNGTFQEVWVKAPGDVQALRHSRHLVSAPLQSSVDFVSVFPGAYVFYGDASKKAVAIYNNDLPYLFPDAMRHFAQKASKDSTEVVSDMSAEDMARLQESYTAHDGSVVSHSHAACMNVRMWRTEYRSYCTSDKDDGCGRADVSFCEEMKLDLKFRR